MTMEATFLAWSQRPSPTEREKCAHAESVVKGIIQDDPTLSTHDVRVFVQGSYNAHTNVKQDSDVDICVCHPDFFYEFPAGYSQDPAAYNISPGQLTYPHFKDLVETAL